MGTGRWQAKVAGQFACDGGDFVSWHCVSPASDHREQLAHAVEDPTDNRIAVTRDLIRTRKFVSRESAESGM